MANIDKITNSKGFDYMKAGQGNVFILI